LEYKLVVHYLNIDNKGANTLIQTKWHTCSISLPWKY